MSEDHLLEKDSENLNEILKLSRDNPNSKSNLNDQSWNK